MDVIQYLREQNDLNVSAIAKRMWPKNKTAKGYLSAKLAGNRPFTSKDRAKLKQVLNDLGLELLNLTE